MRPIAGIESTGASAMGADGTRGAGRTALLIGNYRPALAAARELHRLGWRVLLGCEPDSRSAESSRYVSETWAMPALSPGHREFRAAFAEVLATRPEIGLVLPITEATMNAVSAVRDVVPEGALLAIPPPNVLEVCHDKMKWLEFASAAGVRCPPFGVASSLTDLKRVVREIGYPVVVRPAEAGKRIGKRKALMLDNEADFDRQLPAWPSPLSAILAQRRFMGERFNVYFGAADGVMIRELTTRSVRTDRYDGSGQTIEGVIVDRVPAMSAEVGRVAAALRYTGVGCAQFLLADDGSSCFLEINPRFGASYVFAERAGFELTRLAISLAVPGAPGKADPRPVRKLRFVWSYGDFSGLIYSLRKGEIGVRQAIGWGARALLAAIRADVHVMWSWDDPRPAILQYTSGLFRRRAKTTAHPAPAITEA